MTAAIAAPFLHVEDANGNPYVAAQLYVFVSNTTTLAAIYSDKELTSSLDNPLTSDTAGNFLRAYVAAGTYKLRLETSADVGIWEYDYIDTGLINSGTLPIASGGTAATTAAAARTALGAAAQTDVDDLSADITVLQSQVTNFAGLPGGRLTLTTATPILATGISAATSVFYTPYISTQVPVWDGTQFVLKTFAELTLALVASHAASSIYDIFIFLDTATVTIGTGPAWTTATAGAGARGTGAGTTELVRQNGLWVNANSMTTRNGATTYTVAAKKGIYIGSMPMDGTNGQISCHTAWGQSRKWGIWNAYNRKRIFLQGGDATASWTYNSSTIRASNGDSANKLTVFSGLAEEAYDCRFAQRMQIGANANAGEANNIIGYNATNALSGTEGNVQFTIAAATVNNIRMSALAQYRAPPSIGINNVQACERTPAATATCTFYGVEDDMKLTAEWWG